MLIQMFHVPSKIRSCRILPKSVVILFLKKVLP